jgi:tRNA threonylcarbamoyladenosine biosynthesis protein TsaE
MERRNNGMSPLYVYDAASEADTAAFAAELARRAMPGAVVALDGELGAGKTRFTQAFASALGVTEVVSSPTFTIIKEYESGRLPFYHMDVYRLSLMEADELGLEDYFFGDGATLVEWASLIEPILPPDRLHVSLEWTGETSRRLWCMPIGEPYAAWCKDMGLRRSEEGIAP